jgi:hypothetical protein
MSGYDHCVQGRPRLREITICAADSVNPALAARALGISVERCDFGDAILFSDAPVAGPFRSVVIERLSSRADYSRFILKELAQRIATPFVLVVQWDGYVVDPDAWLADFLHYDYIGARWPWHSDGFNVGNGGFSLRSRRLLEACADPRLPVEPGVGRGSRRLPPVSKSAGDRVRRAFRPRGRRGSLLARARAARGRTFGFHGLFNLWRWEPDEALVALAARIHADVLNGTEYAELLGECFSRKRLEPARALYARLRETRSPAEVEAHLAGLIRETSFIAAMVRACEERFLALSA